MIIDLPRFIAAARPHWDELEQILDRLAAEPDLRLDIDRANRFYVLSQRCAADLARVQTFSAEPEVRAHLESLVLRAYGEIHETRERSRRWRPWEWFRRTLPRTFRRHAAAFGLAVAVTVAGCAFGGIAMLADPDAKAALLPEPHLRLTPSQRVAREERATADPLAGAKTTFSAFLMTHNIRVSLLALALGMTWGIGTAVLLFANGVTLGAIVVDYVADGQGTFLAGWLLPHGAVEIPSILIAGQAGLILAHALIGRADARPLGMRLRRILPDLLTLIGGVAILLVWAGTVEAFLSQYHAPFLPYGIKIALGCVELALLTWFLTVAGRDDGQEAPVSKE
ncbi:MAG TPA: stage II sporulation protein M [Thermoanaerobaculia bacterium]